MWMEGCWSVAVFATRRCAPLAIPPHPHRELRSGHRANAPSIGPRGPGYVLCRCDCVHDLRDFLGLGHFHPQSPSLRPLLIYGESRVAGSLTCFRANTIHPVLHDQLLAAQQHLQGSRPQAAPQHQHLQPNTASPRDQANIDPAISGAAMMTAAPQTPTQPQQASPEDVTPKSYGKRELSTSKRAAQNRAAQVRLHPHQSSRFSC